MTAKFPIKIDNDFITKDSKGRVFLPPGNYSLVPGTNLTNIIIIGAGKFDGRIYLDRCVPNPNYGTFT